MRALITCSGLSNTGRLTTQAAIVLVSRSPGAIAWARAHKGERLIADVSADADQIIVIDGCSDHCAAKKCGFEGVTADIHIVATELGVKKDGLADVKWDDVVTLLAAVDREINGR